MKYFKYVLGWIILIIISFFWYRAYTLEVAVLNTKTSWYNAPELRISPYWTQDKFIDWVLKTKYDLRFWLYSLSLKEAEQLLKNLSNLWLDITWIWENNPYDWIDKEFLKLKDRFKEAGIKVFDDEHLWLNFNHTKTYIADDNRFLITTANLTYSSMWRNREYRYADTHTWIVSSLQTIFDKDLIWETIETKDIHQNLLVCPINCREVILQSINDALVSIDVAVQYLQDQEVRDLLLRRSQEIPVRILLWFRQDEGRVDWFRPDQAKILPEPYLHTKNILIDSEVLIHGSMNISSNSLDNNREIGIIIEDPKSISIFSRQFETDRENWISHVDWEFEK